MNFLLVKAMAQPPSPRTGSSAGARGLLVLLFTVVGSPHAHGAPGWNEVQAVFLKRCVMCHSGENAARGLRLDSYEGVISGSENGFVLVPGDISGSELIRRVWGQSKPRMPFLSYPLGPDEISLIERWVEAGAPQEDLDHRK